VITVRNLLRNGVRKVGRGENPAPYETGPDGVIATSARSTILRVPPAPTLEEDRDLLRATARRVLAGEFPKPSSRS